MLDKKSLIALILAGVALSFAEGTMASHGGSAKKSITFPTSSTVECTFGFEQATLTYKEDGGDPRIELKTIAGESSPCKHVASGSVTAVDEAEVDITAHGITRSCKKVPGENASVENYIGKCGGGNDTTGTVDFINGDITDIGIGGAAVLNGKDCHDVFPEDASFDPVVGRGVMTLTSRYFVGTTTCDENEGEGADGPIVLRMCNSELGCALDDAGDPVIAQGALDQLTTFDLVCQRNPVNLDCPNNGVVKGTISGADTDVGNINLGSVICGDTNPEAAQNFEFDDFIPEGNPDGKQDLKVTCHRCVGGQTVLEDGNRLIITWDTQGTELKRGVKFAEAKEGGDCTVNE